jgi:hypothetical protein
MEDRDQAVMRLYTSHYRALVRLAALLVKDESAAEKVVKASFGTLLDRWSGLSEEDRSLTYLKREVVRRARSVPRARN